MPLLTFAKFSLYSFSYKQCFFFSLRVYTLTQFIGIGDIDLPVQIFDIIVSLFAIYNYTIYIEYCLIIICEFREFFLDESSAMSEVLNQYLTAGVCQVPLTFLKIRCFFMSSYQIYHIFFIISFFLTDSNSYVILIIEQMSK